MESCFKFLREYQRFKILDLVENKAKQDYYKSQIDQLLKQGILLTETTDVYYFKFVGAINFLEKMIIIFPKYKSLPEKELTYQNKEYAQQLFKIFEKYEAKSVREDNLLAKDYNEEKDYFSLFALYKELIEDYMKNGLYENQKSIYEVSGMGQIDWSKTVNEIHPFFSSTMRPIYIDYYSHDIEEEQENYIKFIQMELLAKATKYFDQFKELGLDIIDLDYHFDESAPGEISYKIYKIDSELRQVFIERKIKLLNLMKEILENLEHSKTNDLSLYGTKNYEKVWEHICQDVFGHQKKWIEKIIKPKWEDFKTNKISEVNTLLPDITIQKDDSFYILDAKYYNCKFDENGKLVGSKPGVGDISKQFLYQEAYEDYFKEKNKEYKYYNAFLMPTEDTDEKFEIIGEVTFPLKVFDDKVIKIIKLNTKIIYNFYLKDEKIKGRFIEIFL
ncbi:LlaJI family restriction endonuclease [Cetobacterium sp.]|uniref:LlaJI family restriction endonuclease n=1 Tax=Cetobacterium sp. TaxID=2071632 RepID=UPI003F3BCF7D